ncbi:MAG: RNA polymerase sigma factor [Comamonadaceae bacterium]
MSQQPVVAHIPSLRRYARALTGDVWAADDLVQDTLERACSRWRLWLAGTDLRAWLFTLMHNLFISQVRQGLTRAKLAPTVDLEDVADELRAPELSIGLAIDLQRCLLRLPDDQRAVLLLVTMEDLSYDEVARVTGVPVGTVMSRLSRARGRMRELLDEPKARAATNESGNTAQMTAPVLRRMK